MHPSSPGALRHSQRVILCPLLSPSANVGVLADLVGLILYRFVQVTISLGVQWAPHAQKMLSHSALPHSSSYFLPAPCL